MACKHIGPVSFSELTEVKRFNRAAFKSILNALKLLLLGEVHTLEFIQQRDVAEMAVLAASQQVSRSLHRRVVETSVKSDLVGRFCVSRTFLKQTRQRLALLEKPHFD